MKLVIDDNEYDMDLTKAIQFYRILYTMARGDGLKLANGKMLQMGSNSLMRTALKMVMTPVVLPFVKSMYAERGMQLAPPEKHADLIDYCFNAVLDFAIASQEKLRVNLASKNDTDCGKSIVSIAAAWQQTDEQKTDEQKLIGEASTSDH